MQSLLSGVSALVLECSQQAITGCYITFHRCCLQGIHYKERDRPQPPLSRFAPALTQSTSLHSLPEVLADWQNLEYAFLSPIFDSISKEGYTAAGFDQQELADALQQAHMPVYALGGVSIDKVPLVGSMGFQGIGLLGAVWGSVDPVAALQEFQDAVCNS
jgi:thiamine-phosphate pyrophosphorylase